ncbi:RNA polymerase III transcription factor IIIC subunit-domain-containing protein [Lentinula aff. lateritia]|uniref:RNA polymerase III transcription factor IIIC subunit-domain-containing protein n=1 Tax=Lentinula aff. lateritia TaxID=2804960 RepID=A0ACC1U8I6_9AGAR|nr:RNA polymerase III transcription factor IIIC subunit-domain-containing protein [Lentinula aff. lateritia]
MTRSQHQSPPEKGLLTGAVSGSVFASPTLNGQPASVPQAIRNLGGPSSLETAFRRGTSKSETLVELKLQPDDSFVHPVPGEVVANDVSLSNVASTLGPPEMNIYPQLVEEGIDTVRNTKPSSNQALRSNLRLFPLPIFSRQGIAQSYKLVHRRNPASIVPTVVNEETGEKRRMNNRMRWKGYGPATIAFLDPTMSVAQWQYFLRINEIVFQAPGKPPKNVEAVREQVDKKILNKLDELFAQRPVWTRASLFNQISTTVAKEIYKSVWAFTQISSEGSPPWRDTLVKLGYNPRKDPERRLDVLPNFGLVKEASGSYPVYANSVHLLTVADDVAVPRSRITLVGRPRLADLGPTVNSENRGPVLALNS